LKSVIVGLDAGLNSALAILSLSGDLLFLETFRGYNRGEIIRKIIKFGRPILISTDKRETPKAAKEIASSFGCRILRPRRDLSREEKEEVTRDYKDLIKDSHQLDALSSAIFAYRKVKKKIEAVERYLMRRGLISYLDEVVYYLFKLRGVNIEQVIEKFVSGEREIKKEESALKFEKKEDIFVEFLEERLRLEKELDRFREELSSYKKMKLRFDELLELKRDFSKLKHYFNLLKDMEKAWNLGLIPVLPLEKIENLDELENYIGLEGRIIFSNDVDGFNSLGKYSVKCVLTEFSPKSEAKFPVLKIRRDELREVGSVYGIEEKKINNKLLEAMKEELKKWVEEERGKI